MHVRWSCWRLQKRMWARPPCRSAYGTLAPADFCLPWVSRPLFVGIILTCIVYNFNILFNIPFFLECFSGAWYTGDFCHCGRYLRGPYHVLPCRCGTHDAPCCKFFDFVSNLALIKFSSSFSFLIFHFLILINQFVF